MGRGRALWVVAALTVLAPAACSDSGSEGANVGPVTRAEFDRETERVCGSLQQGPVVTELGQGRGQAAEAEYAAFLTTDAIPRLRVIIRTLDRFGYPPDDRDAIVEAFNDALGALGDLEAEPFLYLDRLRAGSFGEDENWVQRIIDDFAAAGIVAC